MTYTAADFSGTTLSGSHIGDANLTRLLDLLNASEGLQAVIAEKGDAPSKWKKIAVGPGTVTEVDTGWDLPAHAIVRDVLVQVVTAEVTGTTKTLDVGLKSSESGGDADGFVDGVVVSSTGLKRPGPTVTSGVVAAVGTRGALLADFNVGAGADDRGFYAEKPHVSDAVTAKSVSYSRGSTLTEFTGFIWINYAVLAG